MEAHNSKTRLGTSEVPLVVKFADAKRKEPSPHHVSYLPSMYCGGMSAGKRLGMSPYNSRLFASLWCLPNAGAEHSLSCRQLCAARSMTKRVAGVMPVC